MTRAERNILKHVAHIRAELGDGLTPRRKFDALAKRILKRLDRIEAVIIAQAADDDSPWRDVLPDKNCFTLPNGECVSPLACMHDEAAHSAARDAPAPDEEGARTVNRTDAVAT